MDVYTGALSEPPLDGAIAGPVLNCLITDQFSRLKRGDSHWYERRTGPQRFTDGRLLEFNSDFLNILFKAQTQSYLQINWHKSMEHHWQQ